MPDALHAHTLIRLASLHMHAALMKAALCYSPVVGDASLALLQGVQGSKIIRAAAAGAPLKTAHQLSCASCLQIIMHERC